MTHLHPDVLVVLKYLFQQPKPPECFTDFIFVRHPFCFSLPNGASYM